MKFTLSKVDISIRECLLSLKVDEGGKRQKVIDSECIRLMDAYTPMQSGTLKKAPLIQSKIGSGIIEQNTPYAKYQYYNNKGSGIRGKLWFERMKENHKREILKTAGKVK